MNWVIVVANWVQNRASIQYFANFLYTFLLRFDIIKTIVQKESVKLILDQITLSIIGICFYRFGNPSLPGNALHDLVGLYIDTLTGRLGSLDEKSDNYDYEKELIMLQLEVFRDYVLKSVTEMFANFSEGMQLDFDLETVRILEICLNFCGFGFI